MGRSGLRPRLVGRIRSGVWTSATCQIFALTLYTPKAIIVPSNNTKLVHWPLSSELLHLVQQAGAWAGCGPAQPLIAVPDVTAHPSTASVSITVLLYDGPLLCGLYVAIKGLRMTLCGGGLPSERFYPGGDVREKYIYIFIRQKGSSNK